MTHIREEADKSFEALDEEITIGQQAHIPLEHSLIKLGSVGVWGKAPEYINVELTSGGRAAKSKTMSEFLSIRWFECAWSFDRPTLADRVAS